MLSSSEKEYINQSSLYIKYLSLLAVERCKSGHPGMPLGMAEAGALLYAKYLNHSSDRSWLNRDRFVLSAGHGSMLLYSLEYIFRNSLSIEDIASFRRLGSRTPGHPEHDLHTGVETSTGPLGQGFSNAVGIALQGKILAERYNKSDAPLFDYTTYVVIGDGCNMEGVLYESASLAGHWKLDNLVAILDSNSITIDGGTDLSYSEDTARRYEAMGWHVDFASSDNIQTLDDALVRVHSVKGKPKLIIYKTIIGSGLQKVCGNSKCHGAPVGIDEITYFVMHSPMKDYFIQKLGASDEGKIKEILSEQISSGKFITAAEFLGETAWFSQEKYEHWMGLYTSYKNIHPETHIEKLRECETDTIAAKLLSFRTKPKASREIFSELLQMIEADCSTIICGSADLASSTKVKINNSNFISANGYDNRNIAFGIREHAMGSILNGMALDGFFTALSSTFQVFADYMRPSIRMAALMKLHHLFVYTHDSYMVGEDGPTHQPIEHINSLRIIPGLKTLRPANDIETAYSLLYFMENRSATALILSRQALNSVSFESTVFGKEGYELFKRGAYLFKKFGDKTDCVICASGGELSLAIKTGELLAEKGISAEIISVPSLELLEECGCDYVKERIFRKGMKTFYIEPFSFKGIGVLFNPDIEVIGIDHFGSSGHPDELTEHFGFTPEKIAARIESKL